MIKNLSFSSNIQTKPYSFTSINEKFKNKNSNLNALTTDVFCKTTFAGSHKTFSDYLSNCDQTIKIYPEDKNEYIVDPLSNKNTLFATENFEYSNTGLIITRTPKDRYNTLLYEVTPGENGKNRKVKVFQADETNLDQAIYTGIQKSIQAGYKGKIVLNLSYLPKEKELSNLRDYGFSFISHESVLENTLSKIVNKSDRDNASLFKKGKFAEFNQALCGQYLFEISASKAKKVAKIIEEKLRAQVEEAKDNNSIYKVKRGHYISLPDNKQLSIGKAGNVVLGQDDTEMPQYHSIIERNGRQASIITSNTSVPVKINGHEIKANKPCNLYTNDTININNAVYMFDGNGLREISKNADFFYQLFPQGLNNIDFCQGEVGDCYLIASLYAMLQKSEGKEIIANMFSIKEDGTYSLTFPGYPEVPFNFTDIDNEFIDNGMESNTPALAIIEKAFSHLREQLNWYTGDKPQTPSDWVEGGEAIIALHILTGSNERFMIQKHKSDTKSLKDSIDRDPSIIHKTENNLKTLSKNTDNYITIASSLEDAFIDNEIAYIDNEEHQLIIRNHIYTITKIDPYKKTITLMNPHDNLINETFTLDYDYFFKYFSDIESIKLPFKN